MITILVSTASKGSSTFEFIRRVLLIHTNPCQALWSEQEKQELDYIKSILTDLTDLGYYPIEDL